MYSYIDSCIVMSFKVLNGSKFTCEHANMEGFRRASHTAMLIISDLLHDECIQPYLSYDNCN